MLAYTYLIGWTKHNKWYCGARYAEGCSISDLWNIYFTSSTKMVPLMRTLYGEPDVIYILKTFDCPKKARRWESNFLTEIDAENNPNWLNQLNKFGRRRKKNLDKSKSAPILTVSASNSAAEQDTKRRNTMSKVAKNTFKRNPFYIYDKLKEFVDRVESGEFPMLKEFADEFDIESKYFERLILGSRSRKKTASLRSDLEKIKRDYRQKFISRHMPPPYWTAPIESISSS